MPCYIPREYMYLDILHVFYTYPKRVQDTFWDTHQIHQDTCILGASLVSHWIHVRIHQDTRYLGLFITIHQDTPGYKIKIHVSWTRHDDTSGYNQDTSRYIYLGRFARAALDTHKIHAGYIADTFRIHIRYIRIHVSYALPWCHTGYMSGYMYRECILHVSWVYPMCHVSEG